jgi:hypothetical protein
MGTVTYKNQPGTASSLKQGTPLAGTSHVYRVSKKIWPSAVEDFLKTQFIGRTLHVCCGKSLLGDVRFDIDPDNNPDVIGDASKMDFADSSFDTVLCDPPYNGKMQWNHDMLNELHRVASKRIIFQHWFIPATSRGDYKKSQDNWKLSDIYVYQPQTYFGRVNVISIFDCV